MRGHRLTEQQSDAVTSKLRAA